VKKMLENLFGARMVRENGQIKFIYSNDVWFMAPAPN
jgi:hypothetical protein